MATDVRLGIHLWGRSRGRQRPTFDERRGPTPVSPTVPCGRRAGGSDQVFEAHDVFVSDAHEYIVPVPEDRPAILLLDVGGVNLALVLELVAANVDAVRVQLEPLLVCSGWLVSPVHGTGPSGTCATSARRSGGRRPTAAYTAALLCAGKSSAAVIN